MMNASFEVIRVFIIMHLYVQDHVCSFTHHDLDLNTFEDSKEQ